MKSFKIADQQKKGVTKPKAKQEEAPASSSVGFPTIEALVESPKADLSGLDERHGILTEMAKSSKSNKEKAGAKKAVLAYERAKDLVEYLLETKARMAQGGK